MSKPTENSGRMDCDFKSLLIIIKCTKFKSTKYNQKQNQIRMGQKVSWQ